ncbi:AAA family ATPase [Peptostreptococcus stomatis]|uniref:AAA family ATPase n=1 Tax=Peptostreptococcus stomatis TaxID=341694 RepID=UPI0024A9729D|nr:AAA family ATPase [Peptostreptococcus stomatis]
MLSKIVYKKLFGIFDYQIELKEGGVTIITGPNGFGKSTILKSIDAFFSLDIIFFSRLDYEKITFFSNVDETPISIEKKGEEIIINELKINVNDLQNDILKRFRRPYYYRVDESNWIDRRTDEIIGKDDIIQSYIQSYIQNSYIDDEIEIQGIEFLKLRERVKEYSGETKFIKEQRLLRERVYARKEKQTVNVIDELPDQFKEKINRVSSIYSSEANKLDSSYPNRLFETQNGITKEEYTKYLEYMNEKFEKLNKYNISDIKKLGKKVKFLEEHSKALKVYFSDFEKKYKVFEELIEQLDLFTDIINSRLKFKDIRISREEGIVVYKSKTNEQLRLDQLSSGEKQEIILFYELIFESDKNIHLLIDEPEISLHIEWQLRFMDDLLRIAEKKKFKVTVATHSPQIINNHWDIQIDLGEMYGN